MSTEPVYQEAAAHRGSSGRLSTCPELEKKNPQVLPLEFLLVVGMLRSGTTWLEKLFDSNSETRYPLRDALLVVLQERRRKWQPRCPPTSGWLPQHPSVCIRGKMPRFRKSYCSASQVPWYRARVLATKALAQVLKVAPIATMAKAPLALWKSIESMGQLPALIQALPAARAIYVVQHPGGYAVSIFRGESSARFGASVPAADDWGVFEPLQLTPLAWRPTGLFRLSEALHPLSYLTWR